MRVVKQNLCLRNQRLRIVHFALRGNRMQISRGYLLHNLAPRRHLGKVSSLLRCARRLECPNHRT